MILHNFLTVVRKKWLIKFFILIHYFILLEKIKKVLYFKKAANNAYPTVKMTKQSADFDFPSAYDYVKEPNGKALIKTDLAVKIPDRCYGRIAPLTSLTLRNNIKIATISLIYTIRTFRSDPT